MKRKVLAFILVIVVALFSKNLSFAATKPVYDPTFNNGSGAFYANGTSITIDKNKDNKTVISWDGGSEVVESSIYVFGGGTAGTSYENSEIIMNDGEVSYIIGGGLSTDSTKYGNVDNTNIVINGGKVTTRISGGGALYSQVENANIIVNDGIISAIDGGGLATLSIDGIGYSVGTEENPEESENRTENVNIEVNGGEIYSDTTGYGLLYGGGLGYSYVGKTNMIINDGDLSEAYVTAAGSNGYTGESNVEINGGDIKFYQTVNRGTVEDVSTKVTGGNIDTFYVGAETDATDATGVVNNSDVALLNGTIGVLDSGKSGDIPIKIDNDNYSVVETDDIEIADDKIPSGEVEINYEIDVTPDSTMIFENGSKQLNAIITTDPVGYEELFDKITWSSSDETIATVDENGVVTGLKEGDVVITATSMNKSASSNVNVQGNGSLIALWILVGLSLLIFLAILVLALLGII